MSSNRRDFLKHTLLGAGALSAGLLSCTTADRKTNHAHGTKHTQLFNMSGYAAPKLKTVRIGFIGLGMRGPGAVTRMSHIEGVQIKALCDIYPDRVDTCQKILKERGLPEADGYSGSQEAWKEMVKRNDLDLIYITTPWKWHMPMAVYAMENNKHAATEVPAALTLDECWQLVKTSERTKKHCMMLENCCYDFFELLTLNMARQGFFGELIHGEGSYIHDLRSLNFDKEGYADMWRLKQNASRNGSLYPTHGLGPVCQLMNINRGDKMEFLTSVQSADFMMQKEANQLAEEDTFFEEFANRPYRGNMNITTIKTNRGRTLMVQHDVTSPRPYSRIHLISGTKGIARKYPSPARIARGHSWLSDDELTALKKEFTPEIVRKVGEMARQVGGHGGMDFIMDWRLIDCLRNGLPLDQDVYDAALWSSIAPLSEASVANRSGSIDVPDFTCGAWQSNKPVELTLKGGGTTGVRQLQKADVSEQLNV